MPKSVSYKLSNKEKKLLKIKALEKIRQGNELQSATPFTACSGAEWFICVHVYLSVVFHRY